MFLYRSLSLGLLGACLLMLASRPTLLVRLPPAQVVASPSSAASAWQPTEEARATIVDVAPRASADDIAGVLRLTPDETIVAIDDVPVASTLRAGVALAGAMLYAGRYVDVEARSPRGNRRIVVLLH